MVDAEVAGWNDDGLVIVRGGVALLDSLREAYEDDGSFSVQADPAATFDDLCRWLPNNQVRVTSLGRIRAARGTLVPSHRQVGDYHCDVVGLSPEMFLGQLDPPIPNPVPKERRQTG